ncbi:TORTIFOLIA1-like protein 3 [Ananas comosus]|uniref:TORTIFOLIA1-like protein 3 n=1 Tax=Ananas comosus TaxID=4615 RepID=A0A6P5GQ74_ANACO|nr:TORTIFOLIA1-like protein 3 [Ananas comosus]
MEEGMKQRVNWCMNRLSDRDTEAMAAAELEALARSLGPEALAAFVGAISDARPADRPPLRRHSLRLLSLLASSHPAPSLAPLLPRMLSSALRRLRDPDSSVRSACVHAVRSIFASSAAAAAAAAPALLRPLEDALLHEQDPCAQLAAALCLAAPDLVGLLVPCLADSLAADDWAARKAAAEALAALAVAEKDLLLGFKASCLSSFESRRFDKVKIVRDAMNRMLDAWKEIPTVVEIDSNATPASKSHADPSMKETVSDGRASVSTASVPPASPFTARKSRFTSSRSPPPDASPIITTRRAVPSIRNKKHADCAKTSDWTVETAGPNTPSIEVVREEKGRGRGGEKGDIRSRLEARRMLFEKNREEKGNKSAGLKAGSRAVPFEENGSFESTAGGDNTSDELTAGHKDGDISLIRRQLVQIEKQQSSLLDLLQRFIGSSQNGIHSLGTRVHGIEMALDEISRDLVFSSQRMSNNDFEANTCCRLPGTEFLSPKFWRRLDGRYSSRFSISDMENIAEKERAPFIQNKQRYGTWGGLVVNPLPEVNPFSRGNSEAASDKALKGARQGAGI